MKGFAIAAFVASAMVRKISRNLDSTMGLHVKVASASDRTIDLRYRFDIDYRIVNVARDRSH
jgi:hypothetical protein